MIRIHHNSSLSNGLRKSPMKNCGEQQNRHQSIHTSGKKEVLKRTHPQEDCQQPQRRGLDLNSDQQGRGESESAWSVWCREKEGNEANHRSVGISTR